MKIVCLNTWAGHAGREKLLDFFKKHKDDVDIFCLQEIWSLDFKSDIENAVGGLKLIQPKTMVTGLQDLSNILEDHFSFFRPHHGSNYGLLMMVRKTIKVIKEEDEFVHKEKGYIPHCESDNCARNIQYIEIEKENKEKLSVINFHGLWDSYSKNDSEERLAQAKKVADFLKKINTDMVLCGDFNMRPETESLKVIEKVGLKNLIKEFNILSTRTSYYTKPCKYADYCLVSPNVKVRDFKVLPDEVSDHSALFLEIE
jgi:endonuclease/exonuclease/phosphatase family metal-dependent hydrolase